MPQSLPIQSVLRQKFFFCNQCQVEKQGTSKVYRSTLLSLLRKMTGLLPVITLIGLVLFIKIADYAVFGKPFQSVGTYKV
ncbi:MAG TPA: hypothetical protein H9954_04695, partial [Candidatus Phascolarctobacterium stercoravium]|nr:hypothetical protein [Candidatus Phascolarctobacterium stercoravium]